MRKYRKFSDGGDVNYGEDERPAATDMSDAASLMPEKAKTFKEAFAEARKSGEKKFEWNGKKYTTEMAGATPSAPVASRPRGESTAQRPARPEPARPEPQRIEVTGKKYPKDDQTKSATERVKATLARARMGSGETDTRSVSERFRTAVGYAKGGSIDGCAQRGKTKGRYI